MKAMPSVSICCWPPDRLPAGSCSRSRRIGNMSSTRSVSARTSGERALRFQAASRRLSPTLSWVNTPWPPGTTATPRRPAISSGGVWVMSRPSKTTAPLLACTSPEMALSRVDLPAPLVPMRATISPSSTSMFTPNSTCTLS